MRKRLSTVMASVLCSQFFFAGFASAGPRTPGSRGVARASLSQPGQVLVDDSDPVVLEGSVHPLARAEFDVGRTDPSLPLERIIMALIIRPEEKAAMEQLLAEQQDPASPKYHHWLSPAEFGARFGATPDEITVVTGWLQTHGFAIDEVANSRTWVNFTGTVADVEAAFRTEIHEFVVDGEPHHANAKEISIPRGLSDLVAGVVSLHDFHSQPSSHLARPLYNSGTSGNWLAPADFAIVYNVNPLYSTGINGSDQSIAVVGRSTIALADVQYFRSYFGLPPNDPQFILNGADAGTPTADFIENTLDVEWAGAIAKNAAVTLVISKSTDTTDGIDLSSQYIVDHNLASVVSVSYGLCEAHQSPAASALYANLWAQAAAQGMSVVVGSGDSGAAGCNSPVDATGSGLGVNGVCSTPSSVCVGGTQFMDRANPSAYWSATNDPVTRASAQSYIPEQAWNQSGSVADGAYLVGTGGGPSSVYAKPSWQVAPGVPSGGMRDTPDVSLSAAAYVFVFGHTASSDGVTPVEGTSASTPAFASLLALIAQKTGQRLGNPNPRLYQLGNAQYSGTGPAVFHDVTTGNNSVPGVTGFSAGTGYDLVTGLGSVDAAALADSWAASTNPDFAISASPPTVTVAQGNSGTTSVATTISGGFNNPISLSASGLPSGGTATFNPTSIAAPGSGSSTLTLSTGAATPPGTYTVTITGSGGGRIQTTETSLTVTSTTPGCAAPSITTQPRSQSVQAGQTATLSVAASGTTPLKCQWYQGAALDTAHPVGTNSSSFTTTPMSVAASYWVRVTNACGHADSLVAAVALRNEPRRKLHRATCSTPEITRQPQDQSSPYGGQITVSVIAAGAAPLHYQWYTGQSGDTSSPISGATFTAHGTLPLTASTSLWVQVCNTCGCTNSRTATIQVQAPGCGAAWRWANPLPRGDHLFSAAWTGSQLVAVGSNGTIVTTPDGVNLSFRQSGLVNDLYSVVWTGSDLVAVGLHGVIRRSSDGVTWTPSLPGTTASLYGVAWTGHQLVAVGKAGTILTSPDGSTWTSRVSPTSENLAAVVWTGSFLAAVGDAGVILTSVDGVTWVNRWQPAEPTTTIDLQGVTWTGSRLVAVGQGQSADATFAAVLTSPDGVVWTQQSSGSEALLYGVTWTGSQLVAVGWPRTVLTSSDGMTWASHSLGPIGDPLAVVWSGARLFAVGAGGVILRSGDGITWSSQGAGPNTELASVTWTGAQIVAVGELGTILTSTDGETWTPRSSGTSQFLSTIVWTGSQFVAGGLGGTILTSPDGVVWTQQASLARPVRAITWTGSTLVAVGTGIWTSPDGHNWQHRNGGSSLRAVASSGAETVAVGLNGAIFESSNGESWVERTSGTQQLLDSVVWSGSKFVAAGSGGTILTSPDGVQWQPIIPALGLNLNAVAWTGSEFVAVGSGGFVLTSSDGEAWTEGYSGTHNGLLGVAWAGTQLVAVGAGGTILRSTCGGACAPPQIIAQPHGGQVTAGLPATLSVLATGTGPFSYQWYAGAAGDVSNPVVDATNSALTTPPVVGQAAYWVRVSNACGSADSGSALVAVAAVSPCGGEWTWANPLPQGNTLNAVTWGYGQFVAVGDGGTIVAGNSLDRSGWTTRFSGTTKRLSGVTWTGSEFAAVGDNGTILVSPDSVDWTRRSSGTSADLKAITWTGAQLIVVGSGGAILSSLDGRTWSAPNGPSTSDLLAVAWNGSELIAVGNGGTIERSRDGHVWVTATSNSYISLYAIAWTGSEFVAVGPGGTVLTSADGIAWSLSSLGVSKTFNGVVWDGSHIIVVGQDSSTGLDLIFTSPDGLGWTSQPGLWSGTLLACTSNGTRSVAVGSGGGIAASSDGSWWLVTSSAGTPAALHAVTWTGSKFVAAGDGGTVMVSPDGASWTRIQSPTTAGLNGLAWAGSQLIVVGDAGTILTSPDGVNWTSRSSGTSSWLGEVVWAGSQAIAVGGNGTILTSPDGVTWTSRTSGTPWAVLNGVAWTGSQAVVVGSLGTILTSPDGAAWTRQNSGTSFGLSGITWTGESLVAVGQSGTIVASGDGASWFAQTSPTASDLSGIVWTGSLLVAVGQAGTVLSSSSPWASTLTSQQVEIPGSFQAVAVSPLGFVVVGDGGTVLLSQCSTGCTAPSISVQPVGAEIGSGSSTTLSIMAEGGGPLSFQWYSGASGDTSNPISGANGASFQTPLLSSSTSYWVRVTGRCGNADSSAAIISVYCVANWTSIPPVNNRSLRAVVWKGDAFVGVGDGGLVATSPDGTTWSPMQSSTANTLRGLVWTPETLGVAVGDHGTVMKTSDGASWIGQTSGTSNDLFAVARLGPLPSGSVLVAVGANGTVTISRDGGLTWSTQSTPTSASLYAVAATASKAIAVGEHGTILTSMDGVTWVAQASPTTNALHAVKAIPGDLVHFDLFLVGGDSGTMLTSPDGVVWTASGSGLHWNVTSIEYNGALIVAAGYTQLGFPDGGFLSTIATSTDAATWNERDFDNDMLNSVAWGNTLFVVMGLDGRLLSSRDGANWTASTIYPLQAVTSRGNQLVAVGALGTILTSSGSNGQLWQQQVSGSSQTLRGIAASPALYCAVGDSGTVLTSPDGVTWSPQTTIGSQLRAVTYTGAQFVAVGGRYHTRPAYSAGVVAVSSDGATWTSENVTSGPYLSGVASSPSAIVAVGEQGVILTSPDGTTWATPQSPTASDLLAVTWTGGQFVAVGTGGTVATSPDGTTWTLRSSGFSVDLRAVTWNGLRLVAVGGAGTVLASQDGTIWTPENVAGAAPLNGLVWTGSQLLVVNDAGVIMSETCNFAH